MSFLAQLRQRSEARYAGPVLCYLLHFDHALHGSTQPEALPVQLSLRLADVRGDCMEDGGTAYTVQRVHLRSPPPFLGPDDIGVLEGLLETEEAWQGRSAGPAPGGWAFLQMLLSTGRCFLDHAGQAPRRLNAAPAVRAGLDWQVDADGCQRLCWSQHGHALSLAGSHDLIVFRPETHALSPIQHELDITRFEAIKPWFRPQPPAAINALLADARRWKRQGLPLPRALAVQRIQPQLAAVLCCDWVAHSTSARFQLQFLYSDAHCCALHPPHEAEHAFRYWNGEAVVEWPRDHDAESGWAASLAAVLADASLHLKLATGGGWVAEPAACQRLLLDLRPQLDSLGFQWRFTRDFLNAYAWPEHWQVTAAPHSASAWQLRIQLAVRGREINLIDLLARLHSEELASGRVRLEDGRMLLLPAGPMQSLAAELGDLAGGNTLPNSQLNRLALFAQVLPETTDWHDDAGLLARAQSLLQAAPSLQRHDLDIRAELRDYQWQGVCWLQHLRALGMHGLLADDMGLGKTLQTIAHLSLEHSQGRLAAPALIVAPTSVLHNWRMELQRFAPRLRVAMVHGSTRHKRWDDWAACDVLLTSYPLLVNDLERWQQQPLSWLVLDEAQWIKNPATRASQAARQLQAPYRLCLTGTPVENHLGELWSIMDFLNPHSLGSERSFRLHFRQPIEQLGDVDCLRRLLQRVSPWMLRRTKDQVAAELPPKTVIQHKVPFADDQHAFYQALKSDTWSSLDARLAEADSERVQRVLILSALLRLRQACCDPALLGRPEIASGKRQHCLDMVTELVAEGRAVLLFSQFTAMLDLLSQELDRLGIAHFKLTGQTPADQRHRQVSAFQAGEVPVFLISLKAGGVGLNLTRADVVIHYDPWWNSAAERQASDRAHRIGQHKPVFVYQLITEASIEERIAELQQRKALLGESVNLRAQASSEHFALKLDELIALCKPVTEDNQGRDEGDV